MGTYVEYDEEYDVKAVENDKNPEQPPGRGGREQQGEAASWMIQQEFELLPSPAFVGHELRSNIYHESEHAGKSRVSNDNEESSKEKRHDGCLE